MSALSYDVRGAGPATVVRLRGLLALREIPLVRAALLKCLTDCPTAVVVDVSGLSVTGPVVLGVFPAVQRQTDPWPHVPLLLAAPDEALTAMLDRTAVPAHVTVCATVADALAVAAGPAVRGRRHLRLRPTVHAAAEARAVTREACAAWNLGRLVGAAELVVSELVDNAAGHARTDIAVTLLYRPYLLNVAVADRSATPGRARPAGYGLRLVSEFATCWGTLSTPEGKVTWAILRAHAEGLSR